VLKYLYQIKSRYCELLRKSPVLAFDIACKPEVGYFDRGVRGGVLEEEVFRLQVAVHCQRV